MKIESQSKGVELLFKSIPYSDQIKDIKLGIETAIYFEWKKTKYKLEWNNLSVYSLDKEIGHVLIKDECSILIEHCLKLTLKDYEN